LLIVLYGAIGLLHALNESRKQDRVGFYSFVRFRLRPFRATILSAHFAAILHMNNPKSDVVEMVNALPESSSFEDIQYHLYVLEKIRRGLDRAESEGTISHQDAKVRLKRWLPN